MYAAGSELSSEGADRGWLLRALKANKIEDTLHRASSIVLGAWPATIRVSLASRRKKRAYSTGATLIAPLPANVKAARDPALLFPRVI